VRRRDPSLTRQSFTVVLLNPVASVWLSSENATLCTADSVVILRKRMPSLARHSFASEYDPVTNI
jgi:hypothetical protein